VVTRAAALGSLHYRTSPLGRSRRGAFRIRGRDAHTFGIPVFDKGDIEND
jgi:hypothetical protein